VLKHGISTQFSNENTYVKILSVNAPSVGIRSERLTAVEQELLFAIHELTIENGMPPQIADLEHRLGKSKTAIYKPANRLRVKGWLRKSAKHERGGHFIFARSIESNGLRIPVIGECR
jgi:SOS-response transcriptional repressor LexA